MELVSNNFKSSEEFSRWYKHAAGDLDIHASELIRACIVLALPMLRNQSDLIAILDHKAKNPREHFRTTKGGGNEPS